MPIKYKIDVLAALKAAGYNTNRIRKEKLLSESTLQRLRKGELINGENLGKLCELLRCQPGDILEYVPEELPQRAAEALPAPEVAEIVPELSEAPTISKEGLTESQLSSGVEVLDLSINDYNMVKRAKCDTVEELIDGLNSPKCVLSKSSRAYRAIVEAIDYLKENL